MCWDNSIFNSLQDVFVWRTIHHVLVIIPCGRKWNALPKYGEHCHFYMICLFVITLEYCRTRQISYMKFSWIEGPRHFCFMFWESTYSGDHANFCLVWRLIEWLRSCDGLKLGSFIHSRQKPTNSSSSSLVEFLPFVWQTSRSRRMVH